MDVLCRRPYRHGSKPRLLMTDRMLMILKVTSCLMNPTSDFLKIVRDAALRCVKSRKSASLRAGGNFENREHSIDHNCSYIIAFAFNV